VSASLEVFCTAQITEAWRPFWTPFGLRKYALCGGRNCKCLKSLVDLDGFEPSTSSMPWKRAPNCATGPLWGRF
jgi:hypothetical protein